MQPYTPEFAEERLTPQSGDVTIGNRKYHAEIGRRQGCVREIGPAGEKKYPIAHVMGGKNVYYFLTPLDRGRLQVLPWPTTSTRRRGTTRPPAACAIFPTAATRPSTGPTACSPSTPPASTAT